jgi:hypothetical protein
LLFVLVILCSAVSVKAAEPTGRYKNVMDRLSALQKQFPAVSQIFSIGTNDDGVDIYALRVSLTPAAMDPKKVGHVLVSTHHGNESGAPEFTLAWTANLLKRFSSTEVWRGGLADMEFTVIPVLNISGYNANQRHEKGQDPNRDYASPCTSNAGGQLGSIKRLITFLGTRIFAGSVTVHGYDGSLTYPWGMYADSFQTKDNNRYDQIFKKAAQLNGYRVGTAADVVYPANGCYEDWVYWKHGSWSLLLELESGSASDIASTVPAIDMFYDQLDSSPSVANQFEHGCTRGTVPDLRLE